jgi:hypothetical protein
MGEQDVKLYDMRRGLSRAHIFYTQKEGFYDSVPSYKDSKDTKVSNLQV